MPLTPDADEHGTDQHSTDPGSQGIGTQPGTAASSDEASTEPDTGEAEGSANCDAVEAAQAATDNGESEADGEPFHTRCPTLRALRWGEFWQYLPPRPPSTCCGLRELGSPGILAPP